MFSIYFSRSLILLFAAILLFSTIFELYTIYYCKNKDSVVHDLIKAFSVINNMKKILSTKQHTSLGLECVAGIKALAMFFILAGHACLFIASGPVMDAEAWDRVSQQSKFILVSVLTQARGFVSLLDLNVMQKIAFSHIIFLIGTY